MWINQARDRTTYNMVWDRALLLTWLDMKCKVPSREKYMEPTPSAAVFKVPNGKLRSETGSHTNILLSNMILCFQWVSDKFQLHTRTPQPDHRILRRCVVSDYPLRHAFREGPCNLFPFYNKYKKQTGLATYTLTLSSRNTHYHACVAACALHRVFLLWRTHGPAYPWQIL